MVYLDSSVALAHLLAEDKTPPSALWSTAIVSSRLLEYEVSTRLNSAGVATSGKEAARTLLDRVALLELIPEILTRAAEPFPIRVRTLDALHLASVLFMIDEGVDLKLATYDERMKEAARKLKIPIYSL